LIVLAVAMAGSAGGAFLLYSYLASAPARADARFQEGLRVMGSGNYAEADARFTDAVAIQQSAAAYLQRGNARVQLGQIDAAFSDFEQAIALDAKLAEARTQLGKIHLRRGERGRAMEEFTKAVTIRPTTEAHYERGQLQAGSGDLVKAIADFDEAIALQRDAPYLYRARADARRLSGDVAGYEQDRDTAKSLEKLLTAR
jgi:tetratricopeptide (TPR) repeat protein